MQIPLTATEPSRAGHSFIVQVINPRLACTQQQCRRGAASERGEQRRRGAHGETERNSPLREDRMKYEPDETSLVEAEEPD